MNIQETREVCTKIVAENSEGKRNFGDLGIDDKIKLKI
jgi:hypothetical protein